MRLSLATLTFAASLTWLAPAWADSPPNVILCMGDDHGWEETGFPIGEEFVRGASIRVELTNEGPGDFLDYHAWITQ